MFIVHSIMLVHYWTEVQSMKSDERMIMCDDLYLIEMNDDHLTGKIAFSQMPQVSPLANLM